MLGPTSKIYDRSILYAGVVVSHVHGVRVSKNQTMELGGDVSSGGRAAVEPGIWLKLHTHLPSSCKHEIIIQVKGGL